MEKLRKKALMLTEQPGVYLMKNKDGKIIYVGKAKNLKRRVYSYFSAVEKHNNKTRNLVANIDDFEIIVAKTELEALLLENNLIKKNKPQYNILLKDDKGYPYIKLSSDPFPTISLARKVEQDGAEYFGPFYGSYYANAIIEAACRAYKLPTCKNPQPRPGRRPCLNYRIQQCCGVCAGRVSQQDYQAIIAEVRRFLSGEIDQIARLTQEQMERAAESLDYERAAVLRDRLKAIQSLLTKQRVANDASVNGDYFTVAARGNDCAAVMLRVEKGIMLHKEAYLSPLVKIDDLQSFLSEYIKAYYRQDSATIPRRVLIGMEIEDRQAMEQMLAERRGGRVWLSVPSKTLDRQIMKMAEANAVEELVMYEGRTKAPQRQLLELANVLGLSKLDMVEIYDISHTAAADVVCGMAVFSGQGFMKSKYKKFKINPDLGGDDAASLYEAASRRFQRFVDGDAGFCPLPDAIFADGGLAQLRSIRRAAEDHGLDIPVYGLKKDRRHKTKALVFENGEERMLYKYPQIYPLCGRMQEEAHRFAVAYHNKAASKRTLSSVFTQVEGIGQARARALLDHFKTLSAIREASVEEIAKVKGFSPALSKKVYDFIQEQL